MVESQWAQWIYNVRRRQPEHFVDRVNNVLLTSGCVQKRDRAGRFAASCVPVSSPCVSRQSSSCASCRCVQERDGEARIPASSVPVSSPRLSCRSGTRDEIPVAGPAEVDLVFPPDPSHCPPGDPPQMTHAPLLVVDEHTPALATRDVGARFMKCDACSQLGRSTWRRVGGVRPAASAKTIWLLDDLYSVGEQIKLEQPQVLAVLLDDKPKFMLLSTNSF